MVVVVVAVVEVVTPSCSRAGSEQQRSQRTVVEVVFMNHTLLGGMYPCCRRGGCCWYITVCGGTWVSAQHHTPVSELEREREWSRENPLALPVHTGAAGERQPSGTALVHQMHSDSGCCSVINCGEATQFIGSLGPSPWQSTCTAQPGLLWIR